MQFIQKTIIPFGILVWACIYFNEIRSQSIEDQMFIRPVFYLLIVLFIVNGVNDFRNFKKSSNAASESKGDENTKNVIGFIMLVLAYLLLVTYVGFIIMSVVFLLSCLWLFGIKNKVILAFMPIGVSLFLYVLFAVWFGVPLPEGLLNF